MEQINGLRVLITGGAGFIGSHLCEVLLERGDEVHCLDNFDPFYSREQKEANLEKVLASPRFHFVEGDFRRAALVRRLLRDVQPQAVVHLGAKVGVRPSVEDPLGYVSSNVTGTSILLDACRHAGVTKFLFASSSSVYGDDSPAPTREDTPASRPASPYAATKKACEEMAHAFYRVAGIDAICLRYFTVYGPRQRPEMAIHKFARYLAAGRAVPVYGNGRLVRDYTYISDAIGGTVAALDLLLRTHPCFEIINLASGRMVELNELLNIIERVFGSMPLIRYEDRPAGDVERTWGDISKARRLLGYEPRVSIEEGIRRFAEWFSAEREALIPERPASV
jgi:UDP-glucuronate 4-epimerase